MANTYDLITNAILTEFPAFIASFLGLDSFFFSFFFFPPSLSNSLTIYFDWKFYIEDITINLICNNFPCERSNFNFIKFFTTNKRFWKFESIKKGCNFCFKKCFIVKRFARYSEKYVFQSWMIVKREMEHLFRKFLSDNSLVIFIKLNYI